MATYNDANVTATGRNTSVRVAGTNSTIAIDSGATDLQSQSSATVNGSHDSFMLHGASSLTVSGTNQTFVFAATPGSATISGYDGSDAMQVDHTVFGTWNDLLSHATQAGADTVIHTSASDTLTLKNFALTSLDPSRVRFA